MLASLFSALTGLGLMVIGGGFNTWVIELGNRLTKTRGWAILDSMTWLKVTMGTRIVVIWRFGKDSGMEDVSYSK